MDDGIVVVHVPGLPPSAARQELIVVDKQRRQFRLVLWQRGCTAQQFEQRALPCLEHDVRFGGVFALRVLVRSEDQPGDDGGVSDVREYTSANT